MKVVCDLCKDEFYSKGVENVRIPVLYLGAVNPLLGEYVSPEDFSSRISEYKGEWKLGYNTYNLCNDCLQKVVNIRVVPFVEKKHFGGLCPELVYRGKYKAVIATPDFNVGAEALKAYVENNERRCDSCANARGREREKDVMCSVSEINARESYEFYRKRHQFGNGIDKGCPEWKPDVFMGRTPMEVEDGK